MGRLASGIPQVPVRSGGKNVNPMNCEAVLASLRGGQPVTLLKCGSDPASRLLHLSQILLNDATERGQKIKVVATFKNGMSIKQLANIVATERLEKV